MIRASGIERFEFSVTSAIGQILSLRYSRTAVGPKSRQEALATFAVNLSAQCLHSNLLSVAMPLKARAFVR